MIRQLLAFNKNIATVLIILFINFNIYSQINRSKVLSGYVYNFAKLTTSEKQKKMPNYTMVIVTENKNIIQEFRTMEKEVKIGKKDIKLSITPKADGVDMKNTCLIFVGNDKLDLYPAIFKSSVNDEVLLISENYKVKREILFNLYDTKDGKMLFEINKGNIYERGISINDEILLMGGTEIDVVALYLNAQEKLKKSELSLKTTENKLNEVNQQIIDTRKEYINQKAELEDQKNESRILENEINIYKKQLYDQEISFKESRKMQVLLNDSLKNSTEKLKKFQFELSKGEKILQQQNIEINEKEKILAQKNLVIEKQKNAVIIIITGLLVVLYLLIMMFKNFLDKKRKNIILREQKKEITLKNEKLEENNKTIKEINNELKDKNEELSATLEEIKKIQNQLVQSEKMASLGVLSAGIAHEINNPINFVYAGINSLLRDFQDIEPIINEVSKINPDTPDLKEKLNRIQKLKEDNYFEEAITAMPNIINDIKIGADRTAEIVQGLKSFSRTDKAELQIFNIHEGIDTSLLLLKNKYKNHIEIIKDYDDDVPLIKCYPGKLNQAFLNIISNAIDSIGNSGKIEINTKKKGNEIQISIKDDGSGMSKEISDKIFDPFYTTKDVGKGTGLGLSITYGIISEHDGKIIVTSEPGKGSEFLIKLPLK